MNVSNKTKTFMVVLSLIALYFIGDGLSLRAVGDDSHFVKMLNGTNIISLLHSRYMEWSGRTSLEFIMFTTIRYEIFWKVAVPFCVLLLSASTWSITMAERISKYIGIPVCIFLFLLITPSVNEDASWWITGFYNYLLPVSFGAFSLAVFINGNGLLMRIASVASLLIACFSEQVAILVISSSVILSVIEKRKDTYTFIFIATSLLVTSALLLAPGNAIRFSYEIPHWLPDFSSYGIMMKLTLGVDRLSHHLSDRSNLLFILSALGVVLMSFKTSGVKGLLFYTSCLAICIKILFWSIPDQVHVGKYIYFPHYLVAEIWSDKRIYFSYAINITVVASVVYLLLSADIRNKDKSLMTFLVLGGCATVMMLGFSPTVYASAQRILFLFDVMQMMLISCIIGVLCKK